MLRSLEIRDMLIIDHLSLDFEPGLNVLTGETGAGKSILLDALGFVLGWRGRAELVRQGADRGEVVAEFQLAPGHPARAVLEEAGLGGDAEELILRRVNTADGRKTAWVNDRRVTGEVLRRLSDTLVELHGQQDDRGLLNVAAHRRYLDDFGGLASKVDAVRQAWNALRAARERLDGIQAQIAAAREEEEFLRHAVAELDQLDPQPGEDAALDARRRLMQAAGRIREDIVKAHTALSGQGAEGMIADASRWLEGAAEGAGGRLDAALAALARALNEVAEAQQEVEACLDALDFNPSELETTEERLFAIRALARKHGVAADDLAALAERLRGQLAAIDGADDRLKNAAQDAEKQQENYDRLAEELGRSRRDAAARLDAAMAAELAPLKLERAIFATELTEAPAGPTGRDAVAFSVATNPGAPAGPLNRIASGGELSRFLLALKVCLTDRDAGITMIFDEIDRGVGGATADAVGRRLAALAEGSQVLVVTHSPQVAARGQHHWRVAKQVRDSATLSRVEPLAGPDRVTELARMLAGDTVTEEARAAARALLEG